MSEADTRPRNTNLSYADRVSIVVGNLEAFQNALKHWQLHLKLVEKTELRYAHYNVSKHLFGNMHEALVFNKI